MRRHKNVSHRSDELTYQLRLHDDVPAWSGIFKLVTKMGQFPASMLLKRLKDVGLISVPVMTSLRRVKLVSLTYAPVGTSLQRLKLVGFN